VEIILKPIGFVKHGYSDDEIRNSLYGVEGYVELFPEYSEGLLHLNGFSHIIIIAYLYKVNEEERRVLRVRHKRFRRFGINIDDLPEVGVFATDSPHRPNPIAITIVKLLNINGNILHVTGLDLFNGTPVLDIKPYDSSRVVKEFTEPWWIKVLRERIKERLGEETTL